jgi:hypothetical protein
MSSPLDILRPAKALHAIDQIIGNQDTITREELGKIRGIVLEALNNWHKNYGYYAGCHELVEIDPEMEVKLDG